MFLKKKIIEKIVNLLLKILNKPARYIVIEERANDILEDTYKYFIERLKTDIKLKKIKLL